MKSWILPFNCPSQFAGTFVFLPLRTTLLTKTNKPAIHAQKPVLERTDLHKT